MYSFIFCAQSPRSKFIDIHNIIIRNLHCCTVQKREQWSQPCLQFFFFTPHYFTGPVSTHRTGISLLGCLLLYNRVIKGGTMWERIYKFPLHGTKSGLGYDTSYYYEAEADRCLVGLGLRLTLLVTVHNFVIFLL